MRSLSISIRLKGVMYMIYVSKIRLGQLRPYRLLIVSCGFSLAACSTTDGTLVSASQNTSPYVAKAMGPAPAGQFDLSHWKLTLPVDDNGDGRADTIKVADLQSYVHPDFFHLDEQGHMVFTAPNKGGTTANSANTRSELRYMMRGDNRKISTKGPLNNFALASHSNAAKFASIGGRMEATLHVDHVPLNSNKPHNKSSYAGVIGQIHGVRLKSAGDGFGYGNEPLKIFYKKWPEHETGSVYWNYDRNLSRGNSARTSISYPVWGKLRTDSSDPGEKGIALGEDFSYVVNVYQDTMYLTFISPRLGRVEYQVNLTDNINPNGQVDEKDNPIGYGQDAHYFKAGIYNSCRGTAKKNESTARCDGTGDWATDKSNGDYFQVSFSRLNVTMPTQQ